MNNTDWNQPLEQKTCRHVLAAYGIEHAVQKSIQPEHDGWLSRLKHVDEVPDAELPEIHGKLIAYGYLKFQLAGRAEGVQYKVSAFGREALADQTRDATTAQANIDTGSNSEAA